MAGQLLLLNPAKRRKSRKARSPAQKAATRRMLAANRARRGGTRKVRASRKRRASPVIYANPSPRRSRRRSAAPKVRRATRRYRRNPIGLPSSGKLIAKVMDAAIGGAGALAVDVAMGSLNSYLPVTMATKYNTDGTVNWGNAGVKVSLALALGLIAPKFLPGKLKQYAEKAADGSLTVQAYDLLKHAMPSTMTLGYIQPARVSSGQNVVGMGKYLNRNKRMGKYLNSTPAGSMAPLEMSDTRIAEGAIL